jgi:putative DNA primase/helicase
MRRDMSRENARAIIENRLELENEPDSDDQEINRLAALTPVQYSRERKIAAQRLGIGVAVLDHAVKTARSDGAGTMGQGRPVEIHEVEAWPEAVNGAVLLDEVCRALRSYVVLSDAQADAVTLWCVHTHTHDAADVSPKLVIRSVQKRSGKTRLATALARLVSRALYVSGIRPAALLRIVETHCPTLLIDEIDAAMKGNREMAEALRGLINSGFDRAGARYIMNVPLPGGGFEPRQFSTWAPQLLSGIGTLPETVRDRSIEIEMVRKRPDEMVRRLRRRDGGDLNLLCRKLVRWAQDNLEKLRDANAPTPSGLDDRAADAWEPLLAIADHAGGDWPQRARSAALKLSGAHAKEDDEIGTALLADIRDVFEGRDDDIYVTKDADRHIRSENLVAKLVAREDRPWAEFGRERKSITTVRLASLLRGYNIKPGTIRLGPRDGDTAKGYKQSQFADAFDRYLPLPGKEAVTPSHPHEIKDFGSNSTVTPMADVTAQNGENDSGNNACDGVTGLASVHWEKEL